VGFTDSMAIWAVGARPSNALTDLILAAELAWILRRWLGQRVSFAKRQLQKTYALNLLGAMCWCGTGVYVHLFEPLPQLPSSRIWQVFLVLGFSTPVLFPLVIRDAFYRTSVTTGARTCIDALAALITLGYVLLVTQRVDLSQGRQLPAIPISPWHWLDGRSYGAEEHGMSFDLLSAMPSPRCDSNFVLSLCFLASNAFSALLLGSARSRSAVAARMAVLVTLMFVNCHLLALLVASRSVRIATCLDIFHVAQGLIIWCSARHLQEVLEKDA